MVHAGIQGSVIFKTLTFVLLLVLNIHLFPGVHLSCHMMFYYFSFWSSLYPSLFPALPPFTLPWCCYIFILLALTLTPGGQHWCTPWTQEPIALTAELELLIFSSELQGRSVELQSLLAGSLEACQVFRFLPDCSWLGSGAFGKDSLVDSTRRNLEHAHPTTKCHSHIKTGRRSFSLFILQRKRCHFLDERRHRRASSSNIIPAL